MSNPGNMTYEESDEHRMGNIRRSSEKNELLIKPKLGSVKRPTRDIPEADFIYGMLNTYTDGVKEAMVHRENAPDPHAQRGSDIKSMNKKAPRMKACRANEQRQYRRAHPLKLKIKQRLARVPPIPSVTNPKHVYGMPLPRNEGVEECIQNTFADEWIKMNMRHHHDFQVIRPQFVPVKSTKTVAVRSESRYNKYNPPPPKTRFFICKFKKVPHKIDNVQTTPLLRDERPPVFPPRSIKRRDGICNDMSGNEDPDFITPCSKMGSK